MKKLAIVLSVLLALLLILAAFLTLDKYNLLPTNPTAASTPVETDPTVVSTEAPTEAPTEAVTEAPVEEYFEDNGSDNGVEEEWQEEPEQQSGGDVPTLSEYLSLLICGGCRHNCSLVNPRCMKGSAKAESATEEYYAIYGA